MPRELVFVFEFYVFWSAGPEPTVAERDAGVYLLERAESTYLRKFFDPLYDSAGVGISTSEDAVISGEGLDALEGAVIRAIGEIREQPEKWLVLVGHTFEPYQQTLGTPIMRHAARHRLLEFLERIAPMIRQAREAGGYVHFGGGG